MSRFEPKNSYTPLTASPLPWPDIEAFYVSLTETAFDQQPIVDLIRHIRLAYAEGRIHATTSMHTLVVSVNNPIELNRENLRVDYHFGSREWAFGYFSKPFKPAEFVRRYPKPLGIEKFDSFVTMIGW
ncbi:hypothetical protein EN828_16005 [Mesorhizobium sp. M2D.F.Ca.ET.185.01.1.1]|uniref:hypothetical protein n=1 Tax=unclassified Mesorhizobium TaxID=325217 RepID=UPI000FC99E33|nr:MULTISPECIES: hypothetical protein [unclassified Mesorhizobium]TGP54860.1 hypothetical protein EN873_05410 [bacterium M00.F.Ca.ET.230.01.1.1]TGP80437.1 hypothetical protein EN870_12325 [bacterium M00.F.Ca.ET.227.01.1.1]TGQ00594.1 hypothetical protein EN864_01015 [bacterium M00.F.Ca.ET.221.01.1.1]TGQ02884.1 hypothetical protein EN865_02890 [bacterium M00.F.Ca.ET.222.01.1.1]TGT74437.1 hypothetical protein EN802_11335 [bacterium M00.F.Ca.ET.159.01.1.1]TGT86687.1 hypothetical protein EN800_082